MMSVSPNASDPEKGHVGVDEKNVAYANDVIYVGEGMIYPRNLSLDK
jgi:hypothetical protein